ncbi:nicotinate-nucleotide adenylyltransferase [Synechococcales cyanobacterium C]|uniref:nicotinate-nucleotide adenylyltransferase n=1 Tax=Petrachloros mirabilis ULC683 TaxID=2781853 RepID=A0A8K1ZZU1_9CYAN|nr:nicotinate-nucleotide adenylyltransferase [Petrachloros mirabilis]NCJ06971.1 nicotinate-nucleotide adenylyltransferase [Petrachloros mirabilis ULC683]
MVKSPSHDWQRPATPIESQEHSTQIALFGTSADPPTVGHQRILAALAQRFDQVVVWASDNPFKQGQTPLCHRQAMLKRLVTELQTQYPNVSLYPHLSDSKTLRTVERAQQHWPHASFTLVVGSDILASLLHWYRVEELLCQVQLLVVPRPGSQIEAGALTGLQQQGAQVAIADFSGPAVSSSAYRAAGDLDQIPPTIAAYIKQQGLYPWADCNSTPLMPPA